MDNAYVKIGINVFTSIVVGLIGTGVIPAGSDAIVATLVTLAGQIVNLIGHIKAK